MIRGGGGGGGGWGQVAGQAEPGRHNGHINHRTVLQTSVKTLLLSCNEDLVSEMM